MKYTYHFANGDINVIEVTDEDAFSLFELDRLEYNNNRANTRRHVHLDFDKETGSDWLIVEDEGYQALFSNEPDAERIRRAIGQLTPKQQALLQALFWSGVSVSGYAKQTGVSQSAVSQQLATAIKKLKKIF